jgi:serine/threonine protein phosphatase 1
MKKYAITDIHGCNVTFHALLEKLNLQPDDELYFLGDYIDRGPNSKGVIDTILDLKKQGYKVECLMGNHEEAMIQSRVDYSMRQNWLSWGGKETLNSFGVWIDEIPNKYWDFLENLKPYLEVDDYILVHAGLNFRAGQPFENEYSMMWIRGWYDDIDYKWLGTRKIIHGHTPMRKDDIEAMANSINFSQYLDIDAGCYCYDWLCAFELTEQRLIFQKKIDEIGYRGG